MRRLVFAAMIMLSALVLPGWQTGEAPWRGTVLHIHKIPWIYNFRPDL